MRRTSTLADADVWLRLLLHRHRYVTSAGMEPLDVLTQHFRFTSFRGPQEAIIRRVLAGGHALVVMPTGGANRCAIKSPR